MFSKNLSYLRNKHGMEQLDLAIALGRKSSSSVSEWERGKYTPKIKTLAEIANIFNVDLDDLMNKDLSKEQVSTLDQIISTSNKLTPPRQHNVLNYAENQLDEQNGIVKLSGYIKEDIPEYTTPGLYGALSAGTGQQIFDNPIEDVTIPTSIIPNEPYDIMLKIVGDSMQPAFKDGEYVFIKLTKDIRSGQFAAIIVDGEAYLKKVYIDDDCLRLVSLNKGYEDIIVDDISNVEIVGTVVL